MALISILLSMNYYGIITCPVLAPNTLFGKPYSEGIVAYLQDLQPKRQGLAFLILFSCFGIIRLLQKLWINFEEFLLKVRNSCLVGKRLLK